MANRDQITEFLSRELELDRFQDASLNGLQVEGATEISKLAVAVDAGLSVIQRAAQIDAQMLLVHHGIFWNKVEPVTGAHARTLRCLLENNINLSAIHLPLDAHPQLGNNAILAKLLKLSDLKPAANFEGNTIGWIGTNSEGQDLKAITSTLGKLTGCVENFVSLNFGPDTPKRICVVSGSGADQLYNFKKEGFDTLVTGEPKQFAYHFCKDNRLNAFFPGHYATETLGVCETARALAKRFDIEWELIDEPTGI